MIPICASSRLWPNSSSVRDAVSSCHSPGGWGQVSPGLWGQVTGIGTRGSHATDLAAWRARRPHRGRRPVGQRRRGGAFRRGLAGGFFTGAEGGGPSLSMLGLSRDR